MNHVVPLIAQAAASAVSHTSTVDRIVTSLPWFAWIAIVAIVSSCIAETIKGILRHNERMAMIRMGMNPDASEPTSESFAGKPSYPESAEL